ncbi:MAG: putative lipid II flippase FtsW [Lachnospiraceae bacterium]|nr:putative lipid II flippase FtsW [Lachnospiraceae bacterium]
MAQRRKRREKRVVHFFDYTLLLLVLFLLLFGLVVLYSVSSYEANIKFGDGAYYLKKQIIATALGLVGMIFATVIDYHVWNKLALWVYIFSLATVCLIPTSLGREYNGARRWLEIGGVSVQPAEIVKLGVIIFVAALITGIGRGIKNRKAFGVIVGVAAVPTLMIFLITRNMSSAIIIFGIAAVMLFMADPKYLRYIGLVLLVIVIAVFAVLIIQKKAESRQGEGTGDFRQSRVLAWMNPEAYASDDSFQTLQGLYAIGSGGLFGKGLGESIQKMQLPEAQNDMVFSIICEELGVFGGLCLIALFGLLLQRCLIVASNAPDTFGALLVVGVMGHLALQVILNIAVVTNTIPNTGVTLPFISYGGTSVIFLLAEIGLVLNVSLRTRVTERV